MGKNTLSSPEQLELLPPLTTYKVGARMLDGSIQQYLIEALDVEHARKLANTELKNSGEKFTGIMSVMAGRKKDVQAVQQEFTHTPSKA